MRVRLQKFLADAGIASRRASELIIAAGRVTVNGEPVRELGTKVDPDHDRIAVDGRVVKEKRKIYVALNKPRGFLCSRADPDNRPVIGTLLPKEWAKLYTVGRLDFNSEGLIFLTNDGEFSLRLTHPRYGVRKRYVVTVDGRVEPEMLQRMTRGIYDGGEKLKAERAWLLSSGKKQSVIELELAEGKNREVRRLFESLGLHVARLQRIQIGRIKLGELPSGKWRVLSPAEVRSLLTPQSKHGAAS